MKNIWMSLLVIVNFLLLTSCEKKCPPNQYHGRKNISEYTKVLTNYSNLSELKFKNNGSTIILTLDTFIERYYSNCYFSPCAQPLISKTCYLLDMEHREFKYSNDSIILEIGNIWVDLTLDNSEYATNIYQDGDSAWIETIYISTNSNPRDFSNQQYFTALSNSRGNTINDFNSVNGTLTMDSIVTNDTTLYNLYSNENFYYDTDGIVSGIEYNGEVYIRIK